MMVFTNDWETACIFSFGSGNASLAYKEWQGRGVDWLAEL